MPSHSASIRDLALATLGGLLLAAGITFLVLVPVLRLASGLGALSPLAPIAALTAVAAAITQLATAAIFGLIHTDTPNPTTEGRERE